MQIEICTNSFRSAKVAAAQGANRVELCQSLEIGGVTPSAGEINLTIGLKEVYNFEVFALIRPRGGDFCFSQEEFEVMRQDILFCKNSGVDGVVLGALTPSGELDIAGLKILVEAAEDMQLTFHRAFDYVNDPIKAMEQIIELGFDRILTSGQQNSAVEGQALLKTLVTEAGKRIQIMPGGGINARNVKALIDFTGAKEVHFSAKETIRSSFKNNGAATLNTSGIPEFDYWLTSGEKILEVKRQLLSDIEKVKR